MEADVCDLKDEGEEEGEDDLEGLCSGDGAEVLVLDEEARDEEDVEKRRRLFNEVREVRDLMRLNIVTVLVLPDGDTKWQKCGALVGCSEDLIFFANSSLFCAQLNQIRTKLMAQDLVVVGLQVRNLNPFTSVVPTL